MDMKEFSSLGGKASAKKLTKQELSARGRAAVKARWDKRKD